MTFVYVDNERGEQMLQAPKGPLKSLSVSPDPEDRASRLASWGAACWKPTAGIKHTGSVPGA